MRFVAIDFETANPDLASICQIGIVSFEECRVFDSWQTLLNPEDYFDPFNVSIHGISEKMVRHAPKFPRVFDFLKDRISGQLVVCHTAFDRVALSRVTEKYMMPQIDCSWLDTAKVARRAWSRFSWSGYGLKPVTEALGIEFKHHAAQEDARAAGEVLIRAIVETGLSLEEWLVRVTKPIDLSYAGPITRAGNPNGPLAGEVAVFTGALSMHRREAADLAAEAGCEVDDSVNTHTTLLIVGDQDIRKLAGHDKSSKHRKAESLIAEGQPIRIVGESDFLRLLSASE
jgi:DNA polymerase-3 subunit epsilon